MQVICETSWNWNFASDWILKFCVPAGQQRRGQYSISVDFVARNFYICDGGRGGLVIGPQNHARILLVLLVGLLLLGLCWMRRGADKYINVFCVSEPLQDLEYAVALLSPLLCSSVHFILTQLLSLCCSCHLHPWPLQLAVTVYKCAVRMQT